MWYIVLDFEHVSSIERLKHIDFKCVVVMFSVCFFSTVAFSVAVLLPHISLSVFFSFSLIHLSYASVIYIWPSNCFKKFLERTFVVMWLQIKSTHIEPLLYATKGCPENARLAYAPAQASMAQKAWCQGTTVVLFRNSLLARVMKWI